MGELELGTVGSGVKRRRKGEEEVFPIEYFYRFVFIKVLQ